MITIGWSMRSGVTFRENNAFLNQTLRPSGVSGGCTEKRRGASFAGPSKWQAAIGTHGADAVSGA